MTRKVRIIQKNLKREMRSFKKLSNINKSKGNKELANLYKDRIVYVKCRYNIIMAENR